MPARIAEYRQPWIPFGARVGASKDAANPCSNSQSIKEVRGDSQSIDSFDVVTGAQIQHGRSETDHIRKDVAVAQVTIVEEGELIAVAGLDGDDASRVRHGGNPEEDGRQRSKERRVDADPESERERGHEDENRTPAKTAPGVGQISQGVFKHGYAPGVATLFLVALDPAELQARLSFCGCRREALADQVLGATLKVKRELIAHLTFRS